MEINILKSNINTNIIRIATCMRESPLSTQTCHDSKLSISLISPIPSIGCRKATAPLRAATPSLRRICAVGRRKRRGRGAGRGFVRGGRRVEPNAEPSSQAEGEIDEREKPAQEQQEAGRGDNVRATIGAAAGAAATATATNDQQEPAEGGLARGARGGWGPRAHLG